MKIIKNTNNSYFIDKQYPCYGKYLIDGINVGELEKILPIQFDHLPVVELIKESRLIDFYKNGKGGKLSVEEYKSRVEELDFSDKDGVFDDLDKEFAYKKFKKEWVPECKDVIEHIPVSLTVLYENVKSEFDDIHPMYTIQEKIDAELFCWTPDFNSYVNEVAKKYDFVNIGLNAHYATTKGRKYSFSNHNDLEYMTANGSYASDLYKASIFKTKMRRGSYEEMVKDREKSIKLIDEYFNRQHRETSESKIKNIGEVVSKLEIIKLMVEEIDQKIKTKVNKYSVIKNIDNLIGELFE